MMLTIKFITAAPVGTKIVIETSGEMLGTWLKLELDHTGQVMARLMGLARPYWANVSTGEVKHESWLVGECTL